MSEYSELSEDSINLQLLVQLQSAKAQLREYSELSEDSDYSGYSIISRQPRPVSAKLCNIKAVSFG